MMAPCGRLRENLATTTAGSKQGTTGTPATSSTFRRSRPRCSTVRPSLFAGNDKTLGDLVECILALAWRRPNCYWCLRRRKLMEDMVRATVELAHDLPWVAFDGRSAQWAFDVDELRIQYCRAGWE